MDLIVIISVKWATTLLWVKESVEADVVWAC